MAKNPLHTFEIINPLHVGYAGRIFSAGQSPNFTPGPYTYHTECSHFDCAYYPTVSIYITLGRIITMLDADLYAVVIIIVFFLP